MSQRLLLVIDDEPDLVQSLEWEFSGAGIQFVAAHTPNEAIAVCQKKWPDLVISDVAMAEGGVMTFLTWAEAQKRDLPVILMSAFDLRASSQQPKSPLIVAKVDKPFEMAELLALAQEHITKAKAG